MPYKDIENQRKFQRDRARKNRQDWLKTNGPCSKCGSGVRLEVDHIDPKTKIDHRIWSWSKKRREEELLKCQVLCKLCHLKKTYEDYGWGKHGYAGYKSGCRCDICRKANTHYSNEYRWRTGRRKKRGS